MTLARLDHETLGYGRTAVLPDISFALEPGERVVLLGHSGAGKSTLLQTLFDRLQDAHRVALVPQEGGLVPQLSVGRNTFMGRLDDHGAAYNLTSLVHLRRRDRTEIAGILHTLGLDDLINRPVGALSGGQKQRVALARALYRGGEVIIADEPVSALDAPRAAEVLDLIRANFGTALLALHDVAMARRFATRLIGLHRGQILFDAPPDQVSDARIVALYAR